MSMSEFERRAYESGDDPGRFSVGEKFPADFSEDDVAFAQELDAIFALDKEEIPPYLVQTLLEPDDPRYQVVEPGFEQKTCARVFRQLDMPRRLYRPHRSLIQTIAQSLPVRRSFMVLVSACMLFMIVTMAFTSTSFASGLAFLWSGAHSGVLQVKNDPADGLAVPRVRSQQHLSVAPPKDRIMTLAEAQQQLSFSMYEPSDVPANYQLTKMLLYQGQDQQWADGPILQLNYDFSLPGVAPHGTGKITIAEFKPLGSVFQVVEDGAAVQIDNGHIHGIMVDGQWEPINKSSHEWVYDTRSELIYERDGIIFWIRGDQRDGIDGNTLLNIASSLQVLNVTRALHTNDRLGVDSVVQSSDDSTGAFAGEVIYIENGAGPTLMVIGATPAQPSTPVTKPAGHRT